MLPFFTILLFTIHGQDQVTFLHANEHQIAETIYHLHTEQTRVEVDGQGITCSWNPETEIHSWTVQSHRRKTEKEIRTEFERALGFSERPVERYKFVTKIFTYNSKVANYYALACMPPSMARPDSFLGSTNHSFFSYHNSSLKKNLYAVSIYEGGFHFYENDITDLKDVKKVMWISPYSLLCLHDDHQLSFLQINKDDLYLEKHTLMPLLPDNYAVIDIEPHPTIGSSFYLVYQKKELSLMSQLKNWWQKETDNKPYSYIERIDNAQTFWTIFSERKLIFKSDKPLFIDNNTLMITPHDAHGFSTIANPVFTATTQNVNQLLQGFLKLAFADGIQRLHMVEAKIKSDIQKYHIKSHNIQKFYANHPARKYFIFKWMSEKLARKN